MVDEEIAVVTFSSRNSSFEQKFNCLICWTPSLRVIYGSCQHRLCENCLYDKEGKRRIGLEKCPTCLRENVFPHTRPDVPEDNIEIQYRLGVRRCPNSDCKLEMWEWELSDHLLECRFVNRSPRKPEVTRKFSEDGTLEIKKPMTLRRKAKNAMAKGIHRQGVRKRYKLRLRTGQKRKWSQYE